MLATQSSIKLNLVKRFCLPRRPNFVSLFAAITGHLVVGFGIFTSTLPHAFSQIQPNTTTKTLNTVVPTSKQEGKTPVTIQRNNPKDANTAYGQTAYGHTMEDLRILAKEGSYQSFFDHALEIRPSQRGPSWKRLVQKSFELWSKNLSSRPHLLPDEYAKYRRVANWSVIDSQDRLKEIAGQQILKNILRCFNNPRLNAQSRDLNCHQEVILFWEKYAGSLSIGTRLAKFYMTKLYGPQSTQNELSPSVPVSSVLYQQLASPTENPLQLIESFLSPALLSGVSEVYCEKTRWEPILWNIIKETLEKTNQSVKDDFSIKLSKRMNRKCWQKFRDRQMSSEQVLRSVAQVNLLYEALKADRSLNLTTKTWISTIYLMNYPKPSPNMNRAWNDIRELSKNPELRQIILERFRKLDPLPDSVFRDGNGQQAQIIGRHLIENFPELLKLYAQTCHDYLTGRQTFPRGNPTINCKNFYRFSQKNKEIYLPHQIQRSLEQAFAKLPSRQL